MRITREKFGRGVPAFSGAGIALCLASIALSGCRSSTWPEEHFPQHHMNQFAFTADGRTLVGHGYVLKGDAEEGELRGWDVASGHLLWRAELLGGYCSSSEVVPGGQTLVTVTIAQIGSEEIKPRAYAKPAYYALIFRDARSGAVTAITPPTSQLVSDNPWSIDVAPDGRSVVVTFSDRIAIWEMQSEKGKQPWHTPPREYAVPEQRRQLHATFSRTHFAADGKHLVVFSSGLREERDTRVPDTSRRRWVDLWDIRTGEVLRTFDPAIFGFNSTLADLSPDRRRIVSFQPKEARFALWDVESGRLLREARYKGLPPDIEGLELRFLNPRVTARGGGESDSITVRVIRDSPTRLDDNLYWDVGSDRIQRVSDAGEWQPAYIYFVSPDGQLAARARVRSCSDEPEEEPYVYLLDPRTGRRVRTLEGEPERAARRWEGIY